MASAPPISPPQLSSAASHKHIVDLTGNSDDEGRVGASSHSSNISDNSPKRSWPVELGMKMDCGSSKNVYVYRFTSQKDSAALQQRILSASLDKERRAWHEKQRHRAQLKSREEAMKFDTPMSIQESDHAPTHGIKRARNSSNQHYVKTKKEFGVSPSVSNNPFIQSSSDSEEEQPAKKRMLLGSVAQQSFGVSHTNRSGVTVSPDLHTQRAEPRDGEFRPPGIRSPEASFGSAAGPSDSTDPESRVVQTQTPAWTNGKRARPLPPKELTKQRMRDMAAKVQAANRAKTKAPHVTQMIEDLTSPQQPPAGAQDRYSSNAGAAIPQSAVVLQQVSSLEQIRDTTEYDGVRFRQDIEANEKATAKRRAGKTKQLAKKGDKTAEEQRKFGAQSSNERCRKDAMEKRRLQYEAKQQEEARRQQKNEERRLKEQKRAEEFEQAKAQKALAKRTAQTLDSSHQTNKTVDARSEARRSPSVLIMSDSGGSDAPKTTTVVQRSPSLELDADILRENAELEKLQEALAAQQAQDAAQEAAFKAAMAQEAAQKAESEMAIALRANHAEKQAKLDRVHRQKVELQSSLDTAIEAWRLKRYEILSSTILPQTHREATRDQQVAVVQTRDGNEQLSTIREPFVSIQPRSSSQSSYREAIDDQAIRGLQSLTGGQQTLNTLEAPRAADDVVWLPSKLANISSRSNDNDTTLRSHDGVPTSPKRDTVRAANFVGAVKKSPIAVSSRLHGASNAESAEAITPWDKARMHQPMMRMPATAQTSSILDTIGRIPKMVHPRSPAAEALRRRKEAEQQSTDNTKRRREAERQGYLETTASLDQQSVGELVRSVTEMDEEDGQSTASDASKEPLTGGDAFGSTGRPGGELRRSESPQDKGGLFVTPEPTPQAHYGTDAAMIPLKGQTTDGQANDEKAGDVGQGNDRAKPATLQPISAAFSKFQRKHHLSVDPKGTSRNKKAQKEAEMDDLLFSWYDNGIEWKKVHALWLRHGGKAITLSGLQKRCHRYARERAGLPSHPRSNRPQQLSTPVNEGDARQAGTRAATDRAGKKFVLPSVEPSNLARVEVEPEPRVSFQRPTVGGKSIDPNQVAEWIARLDAEKEALDIDIENEDEESESYSDSEGASEKEAERETSPITDQDVVHHVYYVKRRQWAIGTAEEESAWHQCNGTFTSLGEANAAAGQEVLMERQGLEIWKNVLKHQFESDEYGMAHYDTTSETGHLQVRVERQLRDFSAGILPTSKIGWLRKKLYDIVEKTTTTSTAVKADDAFEEGEKTTTITMQNAGGIYTTLEHANLDASRRVLALAQKVKAQSQRIDDVNKRKEDMKERLEGLNNEKRAFVEKVEIDEDTMVEIWVQERELKGPRNI
ncbi:hypothetical protein B0A49_10309 [Cryomyces minteri]|uniref:Uncharacterized protein n=1 Tax=Cryomyces minteri TaxID=331657 RepID=A0A4U0WQK4_9PEZI|nr:hypothetical protein B0A49_10309 [Cryomyces minteri]